jgi:hypothetical protein
LNADELMTIPHIACKRVSDKEPEKTLTPRQAMANSWEEAGIEKVAERDGNIEGRNDGYYVKNDDGTVKSGPHPSWSAAMDASRADSTNTGTSKENTNPASSTSDFDAADHFKG